MAIFKEPEDTKEIISLIKKVETAGNRDINTPKFLTSILELSQSKLAKKNPDILSDLLGCLLINRNVEYTDNETVAKLKIEYAKHTSKGKFNPKYPNEKIYAYVFTKMISENPELINEASGDNWRSANWLSENM